MDKRKIAENIRIILKESRVPGLDLLALANALDENNECTHRACLSKRDEMGRVVSFTCTDCGKVFK